MTLTADDRTEAARLLRLLRRYLLARNENGMGINARVENASMVASCGNLIRKLEGKPPLGPFDKDEL